MSIKNIKEKIILVNLAKQLGEEPDPRIVAEIEQHNKLQNRIKSSIRENFEKDFFSALSSINKKEELTTIELNKTIESTISSINENLYPVPPSLDDLNNFLTSIKGESENDLVSSQSSTEESAIAPEESTEQPTTPESEQNTPITLVDAASRFISEKAETNDISDIDPKELELNALTRKVKYLEQWISRIAATGPGGGEVRLLRLDDVDKTNIGNNKYLKYDAATGKMVFDTPAGGGGMAYVVTDDTAPSSPVDGMLWFNTTDGRLYIYLEENNVGQWVDTGDGIGGPINLVTTSVTTNSYTVQDSDNYIGVNYNGAVTITMPTTATLGKVVIIKDESGICSINPITISGVVDNDSGGAILQINNGSLQLVYKSGWRIV